MTVSLMWCAVFRKRVPNFSICSLRFTRMFSQCCYCVCFDRVKTKTSAKYGLEAQPRLVDIIAAVPPQYRRALVPKLKAKPIRTASGVCQPAC